MQVFNRTRTSEYVQPAQTNWKYFSAKSTCIAFRIEKWLAIQNLSEWGKLTLPKVERKCGLEPLQQQQQQLSVKIEKTRYRTLFSINCAKSSICNPILFFWSVKKNLSTTTDLNRMNRPSWLHTQTLHCEKNWLENAKIVLLA